MSTIVPFLRTTLALRVMPVSLPVIRSFLGYDAIIPHSACVRRPAGHRRLCGKIDE